MESSSALPNAERAYGVDGHEAWRDIPGFPDYQVSDAGQVRSCKWGSWRMLRQYLNKTGYLYVCLRVGGQYLNVRVHRLVAGAFLGEANGKDVNHINGVKRDNSLGNLEYLTRSENHLHAFRMGLQVPSNRKLTDEQVLQIMALKGWANQREIARRFGVAFSTVAAIHNRKRFVRLLSGKQHEFNMAQHEIDDGVALLGTA